MKKLFFLFMILAGISSAGAQTLDLSEIKATGEIGSLTIIEGTVYAAGTTDPVPGVPVEVHCLGEGDEIIASTLTNEHGYYSAYTGNGYLEPHCLPGDLAYIIVGFGGQKLSSDMVEVQGNGIFDYASVNKFIEVPEFTTLTAALALIGAVMFAKRKVL